MILKLFLCRHCLGFFLIFMASPNHYSRPLRWALSPFYRWEKRRTRCTAVFRFLKTSNKQAFSLSILCIPPSQVFVKPYFLWFTLGKQQLHWKCLLKLLFPENLIYPSLMSCVTQQVTVHLGFPISFSVQWQYYAYWLHTLQGRQSTKWQMLSLRRVSVMAGETAQGPLPGPSSTTKLNKRCGLEQVIHLPGASASPCT